MRLRPLLAPQPRAAVAAVGWVLLAALLLAGAGARPARADAIDDLVGRYRSTLGRHDDFAYEAQREALYALADLRTDAARRALRGLLSEERAARARDSRRVVLLLGALVRGGGPAEIDEVVRATESDRDPYVTQSLARVLGSARDEVSRAHLRGPALARATPPVKAQIARALGALEDREAVVPLVAVLREESLEVRAEALSALGEIGDESAFAAMAVFLAGPEAPLRMVAARSLGVLGSPRAVPYLVRALADPAPRVAEAAAEALGVLSAPGAVPALMDRLAAVRGQDLRLEEAFERALARITGVDLGTDADLWRAWWKENKDRPPPEVSRPNAPTTVAGPRYYGFPVRSSRVVFVIDVSRSMGWNDRLATARRELVQALEHLPAATRFDVVSYSDTAAAWSDKLVPATVENVRRAVRFVERLEPVSGTNIDDALRLAFREEEADTIFFLSDGTPTVGTVVDPDQILADVADVNRWRRVRIHTIALLKGEPPPAFASQEDPVAAASFMRRLAEQNDGITREVR